MERVLRRRAAMLLAFFLCLTLSRQSLSADEPVPPKK